MDTETAEAVDTLRADIRDGDESVLSEIRRVETSLRTEIGEQRVELRAETRGLIDENRRHLNVIFESLRDDIRMVAEGVVALSTKVDSLRR